MFNRIQNKTKKKFIKIIIPVNYNFRRLFCLILNPLLKRQYFNIIDNMHNFYKLFSKKHLDKYHI